jgi:hypothetical protein
MFSHLQISQSWLRGKPLLYENRYGDHSKIHNYYFTLLLGVFTVPLGAYGLVIAQSVLLFVSLLMVWKSVAVSGNSARSWILLAGLCILLFGAEGIYIQDNPLYGWHAEMSYIPLAMLFASGLLLRNRFLWVLSAVLLTLVKEDGAVLGCCISLAYLFSREADFKRRRFWIETGAIVLLWIAVFGAGLLLLAWKNDFGQTRIGYALARLTTSDAQSEIQFFKTQLTNLACLLLPVLLWLLVSAGWRPVVITVLLLIPLIVVECIASLAYFPDIAFGVTWVPRLALFWAFLLCAVIFYANALRYRPSLLHWLSLLLLLIAGYFCLRYVQGYDAVQITKDTFKGKDFSDISDKAAVAEKWAKKMPENWQVAPPWQLFDCFPYQTISWKDHIKPDKLWDYPDIVISTDAKDPAFYDAGFSNYVKDSTNDLYIRIKPADLNAWKKIR